MRLRGGYLPRLADGPTRCSTGIRRSQWISARAPVTTRPGAMMASHRMAPASLVGRPCAAMKQPALGCSRRLAGRIYPGWQKFGELPINPKVLAMAEWQPIETIPMDGTPVLVWVPDDGLFRRSNVQVANYRPNVKIIGNVFAFDLKKQPTHWMPCPRAPPQSGDQPGESHGT